MRSCLHVLQIVNWRTYLKFPDEAKLTPEAKDLICRLLCDVDHRLGCRGGDDIKVNFHAFSINSLYISLTSFYRADNYH